MLPRSRRRGHYWLGEPVLEGRAKTSDRGAGAEHPWQSVVMPERNRVQQAGVVLAAARSSTATSGPSSRECAREPCLAVRPGIARCGAASGDACSGKRRIRRRPPCAPAIRPWRGGQVLDHAPAAWQGVELAAANGKLPMRPAVRQRHQLYLGRQTRSSAQLARDDRIPAAPQPPDTLRRSWTR